MLLLSDICLLGLTLSVLAGAYYGIKYTTTIIDEDN